MIKITLPNAWDFDGPAASLVKVHSRGLDADYMEKRAAAGIFKQADLRPKPGHSLIHLIALGDAEVYGNNRNGDFFFGHPRKLDIPQPEWDKVWCQGSADEFGIRKEGFWHPREEQVKNPQTGVMEKVSHFTDRVHTGNAQRMETFLKYAHVFSNHANKPFERPDENNPKKTLPPDKIHGEVKAAAHNPHMHRGELFIEVPNDDFWGHDLEKLARGEDVAFSMASKVPWDVCMVCGHKAPKIDYYCPHVAQHMTALTKEGHVHGVANDYASFFDISKVVKPADRIAWSLYGVMEKAASARGNDQVKLAAELAELAAFGSFPGVEVLAAHQPTKVRQRLGLLDKLATIEKTVPMLAQGRGKHTLQGLLSGRGNLQKTASVRPTQVNDLFRALADRTTCLRLREWAGTVLGEEKAAAMTATIDAAARRLPGAFNRCLVNGEQVAGNFAYDPSGSYPDRDLRKTAELVERLDGLTPENVASRAVARVIGDRKPLSLQTPGLEKQADAAAEELVRNYVSYQLGFLDHVARTQPALTDFVAEALVLRHHV